NNKSWEWESWREDGWGNSKGEGEDGWWGGQWEKAGSRKKGYKEKKKPTAEDDDADAALWDMPDTSVQPDGEGGLDQWTLGHLPVHERLMEGEQTSGVPKALPENALTLEELERDHLAAPSAPPVVPARPMPQSAPPVSAPMPNVAPPTTKPMIDSPTRAEMARGKGAADDKTYSPRTEGYIKQLTGVLDFFAYSRSDIAALVRRCHFDENQIQIAVANIVEDRQNHEQKEWGTVKNKKQAK
ncbi:unnamed protein product, partial [Symbiodinium pilosum]